MRKIFVVGKNSGDYMNWMQGERTHRMGEAELVVFTGGEDVSPELYGDKPHVTTHSNPERDKREVEAYKEAYRTNKKMVGICRGSQFLCVMSGGKLVQHQNNPGFMHRMRTFDNKEIWVSSTHHQAQYPWGLPAIDYTVLGWTTDASDYHFNGAGEELIVGVDNPIHMRGREVEVCYYRKSNCLCIQSHPEMIFSKRFADREIMESMEWMQSQLNRLVWNTLI
jgi:hypothetical protein